MCVRAASGSVDGVIALPGVSLISARFGEFWAYINGPSAWAGYLFLHDVATCRLHVVVFKEVPVGGVGLERFKIIIIIKLQNIVLYVAGICCFTKSKK